LTQTSNNIKKVQTAPCKLSPCTDLKMLLFHSVLAVCP